MKTLKTWPAARGRLFSAFIGSAMLVGTASTAHAANWFKLRGTEPGGIAHTLQVQGFLQSTYAKDFSDEIRGAVGPLAPANGTLPVPGTLAPDRNSQQSFYMARARIGIRGTMIPVSNDIDYFILTEWGQNGVTRGGGLPATTARSLCIDHRVTVDCSALSGGAGAECGA